MEILKKKIQESSDFLLGGCEMFINTAHVFCLLKDFEERRKKSNQFADSFMNQQREEIKRLEKENAHLKICVEKNIGDACLWEQRYDTLVQLTCRQNSIAENFIKASPWIPIDYPPTTDDQNVLVYNSIAKVYPIIAVYDKEDNNFYGLHLQSAFPLDVTHWCEIAELPENS